MTERLLLGREEDIPEGSARGFDPHLSGRNTLFVVRRNGQLFAYRDLCPHYETTTLPWRKHAYLNARADRIVCSAHGAEFDIASGLCVQGACEGRHLARLSLICVDGLMFVDNPPRS
jgi:nitrite reductase/ring-hydroxylating ferredoxin subunit